MSCPMYLTNQKKKKKIGPLFLRFFFCLLVSNVSRSPALELGLDVDSSIVDQTECLISETSN